MRFEREKNVKLKNENLLFVVTVLMRAFEWAFLKVLKMPEVGNKKVILKYISL